MGRFCRSPKTTQERKANCTRNFLEFYGYKIRVRAKRNKINLPNAWDEFWIRKQRSWKKLRRTQYKEPSMSVLETPRYHDDKVQMIRTLSTCPRCSKCHSDVKIRAFVYAGIEEGFNFWYKCPVLKEPVIVKVYKCGEIDESIVQK